MGHLITSWLLKASFQELGVNVARVRIRVFELDTGHLTLRLQPLLRILAPSVCPPCFCSKLSHASTVFLRLSRSFSVLRQILCLLGFSVGVSTPDVQAAEYRLER